jgi:hypothetical protein
MATEVKAKSTAEQPETEVAAKPAWRAPGITRIDIKRTMKITGSVPDGLGAEHS